MPLVYYIPQIPDIPSVTRYNHARGLAEACDDTLLISNSEPPDMIRERYDEVEVLSTNISDGGTSLRLLRPNYQRAKEARRLAEDHLNGDGRFVTTWQYAPALAGHFSDETWVVDVYDDPYQKLFNFPISLHQGLARVLVRILNCANRVVHTMHPSAPRLFSKDRRFARNGALASQIEPGEKPSRDPLRCVWAGRPRIDRGMEPLLEALPSVKNPLHVDVYGRTDPEVERLAETLGVAGDVTFHGKQPHDVVLETLEQSHVGLGTYPNREDWRFAYPIKIGEYLAAGAIPLCSPFPGSRELARGTAVYASPVAENIAEKLNWLADLSEHRFEEMSAECRGRATDISWSKERAWFAHQAIE